MLKGQKHSPESIQRMSEKRKGKCLGDKNPMFDVHRFGSANPNYGRKHTPEEIELMSINRRGKNMDTDCWNWKGDEAHMWALHIWVKRRRPQPSSGMCERCNERPFTEIACINYIYKRDINNFRWSCHRCNIKDMHEYKERHGVYLDAYGRNLSIAQS